MLDRHLVIHVQTSSIRRWEVPFTGIVPAFDRGAGAQAMFALTDLAVLAPLGPMLALLAHSKPSRALALPELCSILERLPFLRGHREELEMGSRPFDETFPLDVVRRSGVVRGAGAAGCVKQYAE
jgi:hypothetical protein